MCESVCMCAKNIIVYIPSKPHVSTFTLTPHSPYSKHTPHSPYSKHTPHTNSLGQAYNESYLQFGKKRNINFCNKVFSSWDYNITDPNTAKLKKTQIKTELVVSIKYPHTHTHIHTHTLTRTLTHTHTHTHTPAGMIFLCMCN